MHKYLLAAIATIISFNASAQCEAGFFTVPFDQVGTTATFYQTSQFYTDATWDFGDGNVINDMSAVLEHTFPAPGDYTVCLTVTDGSCSDDTCIVVTVCGYTAQFTANISGLIAEFTSLSTGDYDNISWDFGDGFTGLDSIEFHSYVVDGDYTVCLTLFDSAFTCVVQHCEDITVGDSVGCINQLQIDSSVVCSTEIDPVCGCDNVTYQNSCYAYNYGGVTSFTAGACSGGGFCIAGFNANIVGNTVTFTNSSTGDYTAQDWDFGDATGSTDPNPVHVYTPGMYVVCLNITGPNGCNNTYCDTLDIGAQCDASYSYSGSCDSITLTSTSTGDFGGIVWYINNATDSLVIFDSLSIHLTESGDYDICLRLFQGCTDSICEIINVHNANALDPSFIPIFTPGPLPVTVSLTGSESAGFGEMYVWDFGDGDIDTGQVVSHSFDSCNVYPCVTVFDMMGCSQTFCDSLFICDNSVQTISAATIFNLHPNPGKDYCLITPQQSINGHTKFIVTDVTGRIIESHDLVNMKKGKPFGINTSNYAQGCYLINIVSSNSTGTLRWIKE